MLGRKRYKQLPGASRAVLSNATAGKAFDAPEFIHNVAPPHAPATKVNTAAPVGCSDAILSVQGQSLSAGDSGALPCEQTFLFPTFAAGTFYWSTQSLRRTK